MRVTVIVSIVLLGMLALSGCSPSRYEYEDAEYARERESRAYFQDEERRAQRRERARARAAARARTRARQERVAQSQARTQASPDVARHPSEVRASSDRQQEQMSAVSAKPVQPAAEDEPAAASQRPSAEPIAEAKPADDIDESARAAGKKQIEDGYRLLRAGFVKKAREKFETAMGTNAPEASLAQGRSMDPSYLKTVAFPDVIPDADQSRRMYRRAILLGNTEAKGDLDRLEKAMAAAAPMNLSPASPANAEPIPKSE